MLQPLIGTEKNCSVVKAQWNAITKKYKSFFAYTTGDGTGEETVKEDARDWELFDLMDSYAKFKHNFHPPYLIDSNSGPIQLSQSTDSLEEEQEFLLSRPGTSSSSNTRTPSSSNTRTPTPSTSRARDYNPNTYR